MRCHAAGVANSSTTNSSAAPNCTSPPLPHDRRRGQWWRELASATRDAPGRSTSSRSNMLTKPSTLSPEQRISPSTAFDPDLRLRQRCTGPRDHARSATRRHAVAPGDAAAAQPLSGKVPGNLARSLPTGMAPSRSARSQRSPGAPAQRTAPVIESVAWSLGGATWVES